LAELARLLPELGAAPPPLQTEGERLRFNEACIQAWAALAAGSFDAVVLDDWHLADAASQALLARVAARRREQGGRDAIEILTCRDEDPALLQAVHTATEATLVALAPLPLAAVYELVQRLSGAADPARFADRLARATGGNAYFIAETLRDLAEGAVLQVHDDGRWRTAYDDTTQDYLELPMARTVREAVLARVQRLGTAATRLLEAAALAGEPFGAALLASACALSEMEALAALEQAVQAQLVRAHEEGGYGWGHDLARQALEGSLAPARRRLMHHRLALAAVAAGAHPAAALHFEACGEASRAVAHRLAAGNDAHALHALAEAARQWQLGLADQPTPAQTAALLARLLDTEWTLGHQAQAQAAFDCLRPLLAGGAVPPPELVDARFRMAYYLSQSGRPQQALEILDALANASPQAATAQRPRWLNLRVGALHELGRIDEALAAGTQALALAPPASRQRAEALVSLSTAEWAAGRLQAAVVHADELIALSLQLGDDLRRARGLLSRGCLLNDLGNNRAAEEDLRAAATLAARFGNVFMQRLALYNLGANYSAQTRAADVLAVADEGWKLSAGQGADQLRIMFRAMFIESHFVRGEWGLLWAHAAPAIAEVLAFGQPMSMSGLASAVLEPLAVLGQWPRALALVQALEGGVLAQAPHAGHDVWLGCAQAALLQGDAPAATAWLLRMGPVESIEHPRMQRRLALLTAELQLVMSDHPASDPRGRAAALALLPADDAPAMNDELRLRALALHCRISADPALHARARLALADPQAHAAAALALERALGGAGLVARVQRLAAALADWPEVQASFIATRG
jgi:tetratricopeptide (TPR) repeat protein